VQLKIEGVCKSYATTEGAVEVLKGVDLALEAGRSLALTGESGSGKSTLLHLAAGLDQVDAGRIMVMGREISSLTESKRAGLRREAIGLVFQQFNLIPSLTVEANLAFQARLAGRFDPAWSAELAGRLGLQKLARLYPEQLSGGQQQRVAIGRALAGRPQLVLADEPTGNLDEASAEAVLALMLFLVRETGAALLMVTHSLRLAGQLDARAHLTAGRISS
jgi:putative ABC transport system ATP-binding protein